MVGTSDTIFEIRLLSIVVEEAEFSEAFDSEDVAVIEVDCFIS